MIPGSPVLLRAAWVATMDRPLIRDGGLAMAGTRIAGVGPWRDVSRPHPGATVHDLGDCVVLPGLINAHTHLELTAIARPPLPAGGFVGWVLELRRRAAAAVAARAGAVAPAGAAGGGPWRPVC